MELNCCYETPTGTHVLNRSFGTVAEAATTIRALRALSNVTSITIRNPFTNVELYTWNIFTGDGRFLPAPTTKGLTAIYG